MNYTAQSVASIFKDVSKNCTKTTNEHQQKNNENETRNLPRPMLRKTTRKKQPYEEDDDDDEDGEEVVERTRSAKHSHTKMD